MNVAKSWWFSIERVLRQGCHLSLLLFNIYVFGGIERN